MSDDNKLQNKPQNEEQEELTEQDLDQVSGGAISQADPPGERNITADPPGGNLHVRKAGGDQQV